MKPTAEQQSIIDAPSGNILVSAAAGSGKTTVMTERIVSRIVKGELTVDRMLVMTFTNAAAANMSAKMEQKLRERLSSETDPLLRKRLSEQLAALPSAWISTIDSFCSKVISSFASSARDEEGNLILEPGSSILDENHGNVLLREAFDEAFEKGYLLSGKAKTDEAFASLPMGSDNDMWTWSLSDPDLSRKEWAEKFLSMTEAFGSGRNDGALKEDMIDKLSYLRSLPHYREWLLEHLAEKKKEAEDPCRSSWAKKIQKQIRELVKERLPSIKMALSLVDEVLFVKKEKDNLGRQAMMKEWLNYVLETGEKILSDEDMSWEDMTDLVNRYPTGEFKNPTISAKSDESLQNFAEYLVPLNELLYCFCGLGAKTKIKSFVSNVRYYFGKTPDELKEEAQDTYGLLARYFELILASDALYTKKKRDESSLDFSDQEQLALELLSKEEVAGYYRDLFDEIYIDEYQDNSGVQDAIVQSFSRNNVFFVGDVKQSIYRFRHAKPQLFLDRYEEYAGGKDGTLYELKQNFRSVPDVLSVVNEVFDSIMGKEYADIEYDESHRLNPGRASYEETSGSPVEVILAEDVWEDDEEEQGEEGTEKAIDDETADKIEKEALIAVRKIRELSSLPGFSYSQCAILTTSNDAAMKAAEVLMLCGIPAQGPYKGNILQHPDLRVMIDLARITDNGLQDIPLAGVMKSPIRQGGFTDEELLAIRLFADENGKKEIPFCEKVQFYAEKGEGNLAKRVQDFLSFLHQNRTYAMQMTVAKWLEHVYAETAFPGWVLASRDGESRYYALMALINWAERFDKSRNTGLRAFVDYIEEMDSQKKATTDIELSASLEDVVKCMTIHKSKGLEFPYVFLCGLQGSGKTNHPPVLLNERGEMACLRYRPEWQSKYEPHDFFLLKTEERRESDAEKIRLLYVAMTRAEKKLFIIATVKRKDGGQMEGMEADKVQSWKQVSSGKFPPSMMWDLKTHLKKMLAGLIRKHSELLPALTTDEQIACGDLDYSSESRSENSPELSVVSDRGDKLADNTRLKQQEAEKAYFDARHQVFSGKTADVTFTSEEAEKLRLFDLPAQEWSELKLVPAKSTVSELKRIMAREEEPDETEEAITPGAMNLRLRESEEKWKTGGYTATQMGTLIHSAWQYLDFSGLLSEGGKADWSAELQKLCDYGMITKEQAGYLSDFTSCMQTFLESDLCREIAKAETRPENGPFREIPFALAVTDFDKASHQDYTLVQGMIDCWFIDEDGDAVLIDYKSDRIRGTVEEKKEILLDRYANQLDMYARAISAATGKRVKRKIIWLIRDGLSFDL